MTRAAVVLALLCGAAPAWSQFQLFVVSDGLEHAAPSLYDLGPIYPNQLATTSFRLRNISAAPASVTTLAVAGGGFSLTAPTLPVRLEPQAALNFSIGFRASDTGSYSAALRSDGISILLTATVLPRLTLSGSLDFGSVVRGTSVERVFTLTNDTAQILVAPAISVQGADFSLLGPTPSGQALQPRQAGQFTVVFSPRTAGASQGTLTVGDRNYLLTGTGSDPPLPRPFLTIDLKQVASGQQGLAIVRFDVPSKGSGSGLVTLDFRGPADPTVAFATGGRTTTFAVAPGDTQASIPFQTGTTAGTLVFRVQLGDSSDQLNVAIPASPAAISAVQGSRGGGSVSITVTGFDNTRTLGGLEFTFYDSAGNVLAPGTMRSDASADFAKYYAATDLGGAFQMRAVFAVTGDSSKIASCDVALTNTAGNTRVPRINF